MKGREKQKYRVKEDACISGLNNQVDHDDMDLEMTKRKRSML